MTTISVKAIIHGPLGILFLKNPRHELELPGGRPDAGESLEAALRREVMEECAIRVEKSVYVGSAWCEVIPQRFVLLLLFDCGPATQEIALSQEHYDYAWVNPSDVRPKALPRFYWNAIHQFLPDPVRSKFSGPMRAPRPSRDAYLLGVGHRDRERLEVTSEIYNDASFAFLTPFMPRNGRILDVGCGHGHVTRRLAMVSNRVQVFGVDNSAEQLDVARANAKAEGLDNIIFEKFDVADPARNEFLERGFDLVFCRFTLLHVADRRAALCNLLEFLTPCGVLVVEEPSLDSLFTVPSVHAFEKINECIRLLGFSRGINCNCIEDIWRIVNGLDVKICAAKFSQPTIWGPEFKKIVGLSFEQLSGHLIEEGILLDREVAELKNALDKEYMNSAVISSGLRTLQVALSRLSSCE